MDAKDIAAEAPRAPVAPAATWPRRRQRANDAPLDAEALIKGVVAKIQTQGNAEADRLREVMRKAITMLNAALT